MVTFEKYKQTLDRLKQSLHVTTDTQAAKALGMSAAALSNRKKNRSIPYEQIVDLANKGIVDLDFVLLGSERLHGVSENSPIYGQAVDSSCGVDSDFVADLLEDVEAELKAQRVEMEIWSKGSLAASIYQNVLEEFDSDSERRNAASRYIKVAVHSHKQRT